MKKLFLICIFALFGSILSVHAQAFSGGDGSAETPYLLSSRADLEDFRDSVNAGNKYAGVYFSLTTDIDLAGEDWKPIGVYNSSPTAAAARPFNGIFNGNHHVIKNMTINSTTSGTGFFAQTAAGSIDSLHFENAYVKSTQSFTGGIVGHGFRVTYSSFSGNIEGANYTGGIVGQIGVASTAVMYCYTTGYYKGGSSFGGIIGRANSASITIENNYSTAYLQSTSATGGIAGTSSAPIKNCYFGGIIISAHANSSGIFGESTKHANTTNNYYNSSLTNKKGSKDGDIEGASEGKTTTEMVGTGLQAALGDAYLYEDGLYPRFKYRSESTSARLGAIPVFMPDGQNAAAVKAEFNLGELTGAAWSIIDGDHILTASGSAVSVNRAFLNNDSLMSLQVTLDGQTRKMSLFVIASEYRVYYGSVIPNGTVEVYKPANIVDSEQLVSSGDRVSKGTNISITILPNPGYMPDQRTYEDNDYDNAPIVNGKISIQSQTNIDITLKPITAWDGTTAMWEDGDGTSGNYYLIYSPQQLAKIAEMCNDGTTDFSGKTFYIKNDLDMNGAEYNWVPIGFNENIFRGTINGNKYFIKNLKAHYPGKDTVGFLGKTASGSVSNIYLTDVDILGRDYVAGISPIPGGTVSNNSVSGKIRGNNYVGGAAAYSAYALGTNAVNVDIEGSYAVGGIVGYSRTNQFFRGNYVSGKIVGDSCVGGLIGERSHTAALSNEIGYAAISAQVFGRTFVGGLIGKSNQTNVLNNCYFTGQVFCSADEDINAGSFIGSGIATVASGSTKNFYDSKLSVFRGAGEDDLEGKLTGRDDLSSLTGTAFKDSTKITVSNFVAIEGILPISSGYDSNFSATVLVATPIMLADGDNASSVTANFTLGTPAGLVWTSSNDAIISISGNTAEVTKPYEPTDVVLTATLNGLKKSYTLTVLPQTLDPNVVQAPFGLKGARFADEVQLTWKAPTERKDLRWHSNAYNNGYASSGEKLVNTYGGALFTVDDVKEFVGATIDSIGVYTWYARVHKLTVDILENGVSAYTEVFDGLLLKEKTFNHLKLQTAYTVPADKELIFKLTFEASPLEDFIMIFDRGPAVAGKGDLRSDDGETWYAHGGGNNLITAFFTMPETAAAEPKGYNVFRNGTQINTDLLEETQFRALNEPIGENVYTVEAVYTATVSSDPSFPYTLNIVEPTSLRATPILLAAEVDGMDVNLSWEEPITNPTTLTWNTTTKDSLSIGFTGSAPKAAVVQYWAANEVSNLYSHEITDISMRFKTVPDSLIAVIYQDDELVYQEKVSTVITDSIFNYTIATPYRIQVGKDLHVGFYVYHTRDAKPLSVDAGPAIKKRGNVTREKINEGAWNSLLNMNKDLDYNWIISATIEAVSGEPTSPAVTGYEVYRNGVKLGDATTTTFANTVEQPGSYTYQVKAKYGDATTSELSEALAISIATPSDYKAPMFTNNHANLDTVILNWDFHTPAERTLRWCGDTLASIGLRGDNGSDVALGFGTRFDVNDLRTYHDYEIVSLTTMFGDDVYDCKVGVVSGITAANPGWSGGTKVAEKTVTDFTVDVWQTITFDQPVAIPENADIMIYLWIEFPDGSQPVYIDGTESVQEKGDLICLAEGGKYYSFNSLMPGSFTNVVLWANVRLKGQLDAPIQRMALSKNSAAVEGFNVYRNNKKVNTQLITEKTYKEVGLIPSERNTYNVTAVYENGWESEFSESFSYTYNKANELPAPRNLVNNGTTDVNLAWEEPQIGSKISWTTNDSVKRWSVAISGAPNGLHILHKFTPQDLAAFPNAELTHIYFELSDADVTDLRICVFFDQMLVYRQSVTDWKVGGNVISLDVPIEIDPTRDLLIGYFTKYTGSVKPLALDCGPVKEGKGNVFAGYDAYSFRTLTALNPALEYNWVIEGYIMSDETPAPTKLPAGLSKRSVLDSAITYRVYENNEMIAENILTQTYQKALPAQDAIYHVTAVYGAGAESAPSNLVEILGDPSSTKELTKDEVLIWPNPCNDYMAYRTTENVHLIQIYDLNMRLIRQIQPLNTEGIINVSHLNRGTYIIQLHFGNNVIKTEKLIKQ